MWNDAMMLLRARGVFAVESTVVPWARIAGLVVTAGLAYGLVMGSLGGDATGAVYSCVKLPMLLTFSLVVCLPNFYVMNAILGLRADFPAAVRGVLSAQGTVAIALAGLAPVTAFFYVSGMRYPSALLWNGVVFGIALVAGQVTLARHYRSLVERDRRHRLTLTAWFALYAFVAVKVGWVLRPFVGDPAQPLEFLRAGKWQENPYVTLFWTVAAFVVGPLRRLWGADGD